MRITYLLPSFSRTHPVGGYKVHYEYANRMARRGHTVTVVQTVADPVHVEPTRVKVYAARFRRLLQRTRPAWFQLDPSVTLRLVYNFSARHLPRADVLIATAWETAEFAREQHRDKGAKVYLVYDYERLQMADAETRRRILATYSSEFHVIATSSIVRETLAAHHVSPLATIRCGIDFDIYRSTRPLEERPLRIGLPARLASDKGLGDALEAIEQVRATNPRKLSSAAAFGPVRPGELPAWVQFIEAPTDQEVAALLNDCQIFAFPSYFEAWGLPAIEAMACGAALVTYDNGGSRDYAIHEVTALVAKPRTPQALATEIERLLDDPDLRYRLVEAGTSHVMRYDWDSAVAAFESCLLSVAGGDGVTGAARRG
jgi:glycosyltransferase involved in cell wall biosynthesis